MINRLLQLFRRNSRAGKSNGLAVAMAEASEKRSGEGIALGSGDPQLRILLGAGDPTPSGVTVSEQSAMGLATVACCVRVLSEALASLPIHLLRIKPDGSHEQATTHPLYQLLLSGPNYRMTRYQWVQHQVGTWALWGNAASVVVRRGDGGPAELWPVDPRVMQIYRPDMRQTIDPAVIYYVNGELFPRDSILHFLGPFSLDGCIGLSPVRMARAALGLAMAQELTASDQIGGGMVPDHYLKHPGNLSETAQANLLASTKSLHGGPVKRHRLGILEEGMDLETVSMPARDAQFVQQRQLSVIEICRIFNCPPHKVKALERATWGNISSEQQSFVDDTIRPIAVSFEMGMERSLLLPSERGRYCIRFDFSALLRSDAESRTKVFDTQYRAGIITGNEWRRAEGLNPLPGLENVRVPLNTGPLDPDGDKPPKPKPDDKPKSEDADVDADVDDDQDRDEE